MKTVLASLALVVEPGRGRVWLDGRLATDQSRATCGSPCASVETVQVGAYVNQGAVRTQTFSLLAPLIVASDRESAALPLPDPRPDMPPPRPTPPNEYELAALDLEKMSANALDLARRVRALGQGK